MGRRWRARAASAAVSACALAATIRARAEEGYPLLEPRVPADGDGVPYPAPVTSGDVTGRIGAWLEGGVRYEARGGTFSLPSVSTFLRDMPASSVSLPVPSARWTMGLALSVSVGPLVVPVGVSVSGSVNDGGVALASVDGTSARVLGSTLRTVTLMPGGIGYRVRTRRVVAGATLVPVVDLRSVNVELAVGGTTQKVLASATTLGARADLDLCARLEPWAALCAYVSADVVGPSALRALNSGLRWEVGQ